MKTLKTYSKTGLRLAILTVLGAVLMVEAKPLSAQATATCLQTCQTELQHCNIACGTPTRLSACTSECASKYFACRTACN